MSKKGYKKIKLFPRLTDEIIPEEWNISSVDSLLKIIDYRGRTPPFSEKGIVHIRSNNIRENKINFNDITFVTKETYDKYMTRGIPKENDVLFTTEGPLGESTTVPNNFIFSLAQRIIILRPKNLKLDSKFLKFLLDSKIIKKRYEGLSTGTTLGGVSSKWFTKLLLIYPSNIKEQQKIATILSNVDSLIESTSKIIENSKSLKKSLMQKLLTRGIGHTKFKKVPWFYGKEIEIPEEWEVAPLGQFIKIISGNYFKYNEFSETGIRVLKIDNVMYGKIDWENQTFLSKQYMESHKELILQEGDIVLALNRPITNNETKVAKITKNDSPSILYQRVGKFQFLDKFIDKDFFYVYLNSPIFKKTLARILIGSDQPYVKTTELLKQILHLPKDPTEQQKIASILSNIDSKITSQEQYKEKLLLLKKSLMQKLLTGEVRVAI